MERVAALILAAGKGERMQSDLPKVMHKIAGKPMVFYPVIACQGIGLTKIVVVVGCGKEIVVEGLMDTRVEFSEQSSPLGTAHAVISAKDKLKDWEGNILILSGDVPLITKETLKWLIEIHIKERDDISFLTTTFENPKGYGRVVRTSEGAVAKVVEERDASSEERETKEINAGVYCISSSLLFDIVKGVDLSPKGEYYLTDIIRKGIDKGLKVSALCLDNPFEVMGINNKVELSRANGVMRERILDRLMLGGVTILDPKSTYIDHGVEVGKGVTIYPNVFLEGKSVIGEECMVEEGCKIVDSHIGRDSTIKSSTVIEGSMLGKRVVVGPFARLRPGNVIGNKVRIGNFVEVKNSRIGDHTKANHLSYLGDAVIGKRVNIGAGTITCNYDGVRKHQTIIEDEAFIGSDTQLIAPVKVGRGAYIGSGSTITRDVPPGALATSRVEQKNTEGWVKRWVKRRKKKD